MMLRVAAVCVALSGQALVAQDFRLYDAASRTVSNARLTATHLRITNNGQTATYDRAQRHDAAGYTAYANPGLRRVIRWPNTNQGRMQIGEVSGLRMTFRPSQMEIFPLNPGFPPVGGGIGNGAVYQLRKGAEAGSATLTPTTLTLRIGIQQAIYNRDPSFDSPGYSAYVNATLAERVIRWPDNLRDSILIGQLVGNQVIFRRAIMRVVGGMPGGGGGMDWRAETNLGGRPVARSIQALPANQPVSIRVVAMAPGRSIGVGPVGGQAFEKTWTPTQFAIGSTLSFTPTIATRYGIGVGTPATYDKVVVSQNLRATRLTFDGGTILDIEAGGVGQWERVAVIGGVAARSKAPYAVGERLRLHVVTAAPGSAISVRRAGVNIADKTWSSAEAPTGASLVYVAPLASHLELSVQANLAPQDVTVTPLPTATRLAFSDGTIIDIK